MQSSNWYNTYIISLLRMVTEKTSAFWIHTGLPKLIQHENVQEMAVLGVWHELWEPSAAQRVVHAEFKVASLPA